MSLIPVTIISKPITAPAINNCTGKAKPRFLLDGHAIAYRGKLHSKKLIENCIVRFFANIFSRRWVLVHIKDSAGKEWYLEANRNCLVKRLNIKNLPNRYDVTDALAKIAIKPAKVDTSLKPAPKVEVPVSKPNQTAAPLVNQEPVIQPINENAVNQPKYRILQVTIPKLKISDGVEKEDVKGTVSLNLANISEDSLHLKKTIDVKLEDDKVIQIDPRQLVVTIPDDLTKVYYRKGSSIVEAFTEHSSDALAKLPTTQAIPLITSFNSLSIAQVQDLHPDRNDLLHTMTVKIPSGKVGTLSFDNLTSLMRKDQVDVFLEGQTEPEKVKVGDIQVTDIQFGTKVFVQNARGISDLSADSIKLKKDRTPNEQIAVIGADGKLHSVALAEIFTELPKQSLKAIIPQLGDQKNVSGTVYFTHYSDFMADKDHLKDKIEVVVDGQVQEVDLKSLLFEKAPTEIFTHYNGCTVSRLTTFFTKDAFNSLNQDETIPVIERTGKLRIEPVKYLNFKPEHFLQKIEVTTSAYLGLSMRNGFVHYYSWDTFIRPTVVVQFGKNKDQFDIHNITVKNIPQGTRVAYRAEGQKVYCTSELSPEQLANRQKKMPDAKVALINPTGKFIVLYYKDLILEPTQTS